MKNILLLCLMHFSLLVYTQIKKESVLLGKGETIQSFQDFGENGFCIKTGTKNSDWKIRYYSNDLELVWEKDLIKECLYQPAAYTFPIVGSPDGSIVYFLQNIQGESLTWNKTHLTQIKKDGTVKTIMLDTKKLVKNNLVVFCNQDKLFVVDTEDVNLGNYSKYSKMKWNMVSINHEDFKVEEKPINLPLLTDGIRVNSSWMYSGIYNNKLILYANKFNETNNQNKVTVARVDLTTNKVVTQDIDVIINNNFMGIHTNVAPLGGYMAAGSNGDYYDYGDGKVKQTGNMYTKMRIGDNGNCYFYGSTSTGKKRSYQGFFIQCFDEGGTLLWKQEKEHELIKSKNKLLPPERRMTNYVDLIFKEGDIVELALMTKSYHDTHHHLFYRFNSENGEENEVIVSQYNYPKWLYDLQNTLNIDYSRNSKLQEKVTNLKGIKDKGLHTYLTKNNESFLIYLDGKKARVEMYKF